MQVALVVCRMVPPKHASMCAHVRNACRVLVCSGVVRGGLGSFLGVLKCSGVVWGGLGSLLLSFKVLWGGLKWFGIVPTLRAPTIFGLQRL